MVKKINEKQDAKKKERKKRVKTLNIKVHKVNYK